MGTPEDDYQPKKKRLKAKGMICPKCYNDYCVKAGKTKRGLQEYRCITCGKQFSVV